MSLISQHSKGSSIYCPSIISWNSPTSLIQKCMEMVFTTENATPWYQVEKFPGNSSRRSSPITSLLMNTIRPLMPRLAWCSHISPSKQNAYLPIKLRQLDEMFVRIMTAVPTQPLLMLFGAIASRITSFCKSSIAAKPLIHLPGPVPLGTCAEGINHWSLNVSHHVDCFQTDFSLHCRQEWAYVPGSYMAAIRSWT